MSMIHDERFSDSPYIEKIMRGWTVSDGASIRPAEVNWHMVFAKYNGRIRSLVGGVWTTAGVAAWKEGAEILWIKFKLGTFMPHLPVRDFLDAEAHLPEASSTSFWLKGSAMQFPDYENVEAFVGRLVREDVLVHDPVVNALLQGQPNETPSRTVRHRFLRATGWTQSHIRQVERAQQATKLLRQGVPILDTVFQLGYFDQPHLTRSLKKFTGHTPTQFLRLDGLE